MTTIICGKKGISSLQLMYKKKKIKTAYQLYNLILVRGNKLLVNEWDSLEHIHLEILKWKNTWWSKYCISVITLTLYTTLHYTLVLWYLLWQINYSNNIIPSSLYQFILTVPININTNSHSSFWCLTWICQNFITTWFNNIHLSYEVSL